MRVLSAAFDLFPRRSRFHYSRFTIDDLLFDYVGKTECHFLYYPLPGDWPRAYPLAVDSARHAWPERLGEQLFSLICGAQDRYACVADGCCFGMDARGGHRCWPLEYWDRLLGDLPFQANCADARTEY